MSVEIGIHDTYVEHWYERVEQHTYPSPGSSWQRFFRNQESLKQAVVEKDLPKPLSCSRSADPRRPACTVLDLNPDDIVK